MAANVSFSSATTQPSRKKPQVDHQSLRDHYPEIDVTKALACAEFARLCYRRQYHEKVSPDVVDFQQREKSKIAEQFLYKAKVFASADQQCVIFYNNRDAIVAFEGSRALKASHYWRNLASYFFAWFTPAPQAITKAAQEALGTTIDEQGKPIIAKVHYGFDNALNAPLISADTHEQGKPLWDEVSTFCKSLHAQHPDIKLYFTGHSAGGALATIAVARLLDNMGNLKPENIGGLYTFGQPRVGGKYFKVGFEKLLGRDKYYRFEQYGDPMPALPPFHPELYVPVGRWIPMNLEGQLLSKAQFGEDLPTLSIANPALNEQIEDQYAQAQPLLKRWGDTLSSVARGSASMGARFLNNYIFPSDLVSQIPHDLKRSYSSLQDLFSAHNFMVAHKIRNYSAAIQKHADVHHLLGQTSHVQFLHGQLLSCINEASDLMQHIVPYESALSPQLQEQIRKTAPIINHLMQECVFLAQYSLPKEVLAPVPEKRRAWDPIHRMGDWFAPYWSTPLTDETLDALAIQKTLVKALLDESGTLNRSGTLVRRSDSISRLKTVSTVFEDIRGAITDQDRQTISKGREDLRSFPYLMDSAIALCEQLQKAIDQQPSKPPAIGR